MTSVIICQIVPKPVACKTVEKLHKVAMELYSWLMRKVLLPLGLLQQLSSSPYVAQLNNDIFVENRDERRAEQTVKLRFIGLLLVFTCLLIIRSFVSELCVLKCMYDEAFLGFLLCPFISVRFLMLLMCKYDYPSLYTSAVSKLILNACFCFYWNTNGTVFRVNVWLRNS